MFALYEPNKASQSHQRPTPSAVEAPAPDQPAQGPPQAVAANMASRAEIAQAKAEMAVVLAESFRDDINSLRDALENANQIIASLRAENVAVRAELARLQSLRRDIDPGDPDAADDDPAADNDADQPPPPNDATVDQKNQPNPMPVRAAIPPRPDLNRPPPEGTIFCNGGPYSSAKTGERSHHNTQLKKELNDWTSARGYTVKIYRSRLEKKRAKLIISCQLAGKPKRVRSAEEEQARRDEGGGGTYRKQRQSKLSDCPLRFSLLEMVEGSGTFLVKHVMDQNAQHCNHEPFPTLLVDSDNET